ncbi:MAG: hypothetical protein FWH01_06280 [Oscillospiraceae bacterium]|nr:hypothetical protein [Oscillospiraceae bacterium]
MKYISERHIKYLSRILLVLMVAGIAVSLFACGIFTNPGKYDEADALLTSGSYEEAATAFEALGEYRDAPDKARLARDEVAYASATAMLEQAVRSGDGFDEAASAFTAIAGFRDSSDKSKEALDEKAYASAFALMEQATQESKALKKSQSAQAPQASKTSQATQSTQSTQSAQATQATQAALESQISQASSVIDIYDEAAAAFAALGDFRDSRAKILETHDLAIEVLNAQSYDKAVLMYVREEYNSALEAFRGAGGHLDSGEYIMELTDFIIPYADAEKLFADGKYGDAAKAYKALGNYRDSTAKGATANNYDQYNQAKELYDNKKFQAAYNIFSGLGTFQGSAALLPEIDEAWWAHALALESLDACEEYLSLPNAAHAEEAAIEYERLYAIEQDGLAFDAYTKAADAGTLPALFVFLDAWSESEYAVEYIAQANKLADSIKADSSLSAPLLGNPSDVSNAEIDAFLRDFPGHKDEQKVRSLREGDFITLMSSGVISIAVKGNSIDFTSVTLTSKANRSLTVTIPIGTYFSPGSSSVQNMVVREPTTVTLGANSSTNVSVKTACMNIRRSIPNSNNTFTAQSLDSNAKLRRVVALCNEKRTSYAVTQAAVWIVTDNPGDNSLLNTLVYSDGRRAISSDDLAKAKEIVREAG